MDSIEYAAVFVSILAFLFLIMRRYYLKRKWLSPKKMISILIVGLLLFFAVFWLNVFGFFSPGPSLLSAMSSLRVHLVEEYGGNTDNYIVSCKPKSLLSHKPISGNTLCLFEFGAKSGEIKVSFEEKDGVTLYSFEKTK